MSAQEKAVRDVVVRKTAEMRSEMRRLEASLAAVEQQVRAQPVSQALDVSKPLTAVEGWIVSIVESYAAMEVCDRVGGGGLGRLKDAVMQLSMSLNNWRVVTPAGSGIDPRTGQHYIDREKVLQPLVPQRTMKDHEDVRRVLANRSGRPVGPATQINQNNVYPSGR
jgi:hypothetical protein